MTYIQSSPLMKGSSEYAVFISYCWSSEQHSQWVLELAKRLTNDGVHVVFDLWDLSPGQDKHAFMEKAVLDEMIKKVLIICEKGYKERADARERGVGTETQLISAEVYDKVDQEKFIPIIAVRGPEGEIFLPAYLASRMYIDLSQDATFEAQYRQLLRNIYGRPEQTRPPQGEPPAWLFAEASAPSTVAARAQAVPPQPVVVVPSPMLTLSVNDFFQPFLRELEKYRFTPVDGELYDETMMKLIDRMKPLRDAFVQFVDNLARSDLSEAQLDHLHDNLERLVQLQYMPSGVTYYRETDYDNYRFISYELALSLVAALIRYGRFYEIAQLVDATYFYERIIARNAYAGIALFNSHYIRSLEEMRKVRLQLNRVSLTADVIKARAEGGPLSFDELIEADLLLHYLTLLREPREPNPWQPEVWFPRLSPFAEHLAGIPVLRKLVSRRHFERVKVIFNVESPKELKVLVDKASQREATYRQGMDTFHYVISPLERAIPVDRLASVP